MLLPFFALLALPVYVLAAKESTHDMLIRLAAENHGIIKLSPTTFDLLTTPKRTWSSSIQFTALDKKRRCTPCKEFDPSWAAVAKAWSTVSKPDRDLHFFATLDFDEGGSVFQKLGLASAPVVFNYAPTEGPRRQTNEQAAPVAYDFSQGLDAEPLAEQLSTKTPVRIPYRPPINWAFWGTTASMSLALVLSVRLIAPVLRNRWTWAAITVLTSLVMTSGYMFTRIRGMPMTAPNGQWIAPGFQSQYGQEVTVVATIYGLLSASFLMLTLVAPLQTSPSRQRTQIYLWMGVILILFSVLVSFFRVKNRGYPFKLFL